MQQINCAGIEKKTFLEPEAKGNGLACRIIKLKRIGQFNPLRSEHEQPDGIDELKNPTIWKSTGY